MRFLVAAMVLAGGCGARATAQFAGFEVDVSPAPGMRPPAGAMEWCAAADGWRLPSSEEYQAMHDAEWAGIAAPVSDEWYATARGAGVYVPVGGGSFLAADEAAAENTFRCAHVVP